MSEERKSRKLKKSKNPVLYIVLIVLVALAAFFVNRKLFSASGFSEAKVDATKLEESSLEVIADTSVKSSDNTTVNIGNTITFGSYPQSDASGKTKEPIEWLVLDNKDGAKLLLSKYILDCKAYNNEYVDTTWADCSLRMWLNGEFLNTAFDMDEYNKIQKTALSNNNLVYNTDAGSDTDDRVFCLSTEEVVQYFGTGTKESNGYNIGKSIATTATNYAKAVDNNGSKLLVNDNNNAWYKGYSGYWLRTPGAENIAASNVGSDGYLTSEGASVTFSEIGVRPAIWIYENWTAPGDSILFE